MKNFRDQSSSWTYYLEKHPETGEKVEKPLRMTTFPDGEEEYNERCLQVLIKKNFLIKQIFRYKNGWMNAFVVLIY